jgi:putative transposase
MPRIARTAAGDICYHVLNRGNGRRQVFHKDGDYGAFLKAVAHACVEVPMPMLGYCLMSNHFPLVLQPNRDGNLSTCMHWLQNTHVHRYHSYYQSSGHLWQGRFKSFPIEEDDHLLTVLRYVERNPVRAKLVKKAQKWLWSSARFWQEGEARPSYLAAGPVSRPKDWLDWVNEPDSAMEREVVRRCTNRGTSFGGKAWVAATAERLGLEATVRPRGRPRKEEGSG